MKKFAVAIVLLIILALIAIVVLPGLVPTETYRNQLESRLSSAVGKPVTITGDIQLSTFPVIRVETQQISIENPDGFEATNFVSMNGLEARLKLLPLLSRKAEFSKIVLRSPIINLERRADGAVNWSDETQDDTAGPFQRDGRFTAFDPEIKALRLENGQINFIDRLNAQNYTLKNADVFISAPGLSKPLIIEGNLIAQDQAIDIDAKLSTPADFLNGQSATLVGTFALPFVTADLNGQFLPSQDLDFEGNIQADISDVSAVNPYLGDAARYADLLQTLQYQGQLSFIGGVVSVTDSSLNAIGDGLIFDFDGSGSFTETPKLDGTVKVEATNIARLKTFFPNEIKGIDLISSGTGSAQIKLDGANWSAQSINTQILGDGLFASYTGVAESSTGDIPVILDGQFKTNIQNPAKVTKIFAPDQAATALLGPTEASGEIQLKGQRVAFTNLVAKTAGDTVRGEYTGDLAVNGKAIAANGSFDISTQQLSRAVQQAGLDIENLGAIGTVTAQGTAKVTDGITRLSGLTIRGQDGLINGEYSGDIALTEIPQINGQFNIDVPDVSRLEQAISFDIPEDGALGSIQGTGTLQTQGGLILAQGLALSLGGGTVAGTFNGDADISLPRGEKDAKLKSITGQFDVNIPSLKTLDQSLSRDLPYTEIVGALTAKGRVAFTPEGTELTEMETRLMDGQLNGQYIGGVSLSDRVTLNGQLVGDIPSVRNLATALSIELPDSAPDQPIYGAAKITGNLNGPTDDLKLGGLELTLDELKATGDITYEGTSATALTTLNLNADVIDLQPYMDAYSAQRPKGVILPWSEAPLPLEALRGPNVKFTFNTPAIKTTRIEAGETILSGALRNGVLSVSSSKLETYQGQSKINLTFDARQSTPILTFNGSAENVNALDFMSAIGGFTKMSGIGSFSADLTASGVSQAALMSDLKGSGTYALNDGQLSGIDVSSFVSGLNTALTSRQLPGGLGDSEVSQFDNIQGTFSVTKGVAQTDNMTIRTSDVLIEGDGRIDIGGQEIDFRLKPRLTSENARGLAALGIPIRFAGPFGQAKPGLDTDLLGQIVAARAQAAAASAIQTEIGGSLGGVIGGILGGDQTTSEQTPPTSPTNETAETPPTADRPEDVLNNVLGGILGTPVEPSKTETTAPLGTPENPTPAPPPPPKAEPTPEETLERTLLDIFSKPKEKSKSD